MAAKEGVPNTDHEVDGNENSSDIVDVFQGHPVANEQGEREADIETGQSQDDHAHDMCEVHHPGSHRRQAVVMRPLPLYKLLPSATREDISAEMNEPKNDDDDKEEGETEDVYPDVYLR